MLFFCSEEISLAFLEGHLVVLEANPIEETVEETICCDVCSVRDFEII